MSLPPAEPTLPQADTATDAVAAAARPTDQPAADSPTRLVPVLHVINGEHYAGAERVQDLLALQLPQCGFEVSFACVKPGRFPDVRRAREASLYKVTMKRRWDILAADRLAQLIHDHDFRIVHTHTPRSLLMARMAVARTRVPLVYHLHSPTWRDTTRRLTNLLNASVERLCLRGVRQIITVSESLKQQMEDRGYDADRLSAVPNGVPKPAQLRSDQPPAGTWTLGTVALLRPRKGIEVLLDAVALLKAREYSVRLRAVGPFENAEYEREIRDRIRGLHLDDVVEFTGFTNDVNAELAKMDLFVLPSLFGEGMPMVVLEAMAAGVPVVATDVEGVSEAILDGWNGVVPRPGNPHRLADAIAGVMDGSPEWSKLRENGLSRHAGRFSDEAMAQGVASVYRQLLAD